MALQPQVLLSPAEYLANERQAACKSDYVAGEMFAMAGASRRHHLIVANVIRILGNQLLEVLVTSTRVTCVSKSPLLEDTRTLT